MFGKSGLNSDLTKPPKMVWLFPSNESVFLFCVIGIILIVRIEIIFLNDLELGKHLH